MHATIDRIRSVRTPAILAALALVASAAALPASAQSTKDQAALPAGELAQARSLSRAFQSVAKRLDQSVVNITQYSERYIQRSYWQRPERTLLQSGLGSGVIVSKDGYILTNHHVVSGAEKIKVRLSDGRELDGKVVGSDELTDVAVVKVEGPDLVPAEFADSDALEVGEWVVAIGSPFGFSSTVTSGIVSAKGRTNVNLPTGDEAYQDFIQTDAAINPGNSGGPLLNLDGKIVGINSAIASRSGGYEGIGFAIPSNMARTVMDTILRNGRVVRGYLGIDLAEIPAEELRKDGLRSGVRVTTVAEQSPAEAAGLKVGDIITAFQDRPADNPRRLRAQIALSAPGSETKLEVLRDGTRKTLSAELEDKDRVMAKILGIAEIPSVGVTVMTLQPETARQLRQPGLRGVLVQSVRPDGKAEAAELQPGDIIVAINDRAVLSGPEFKERIERANIDAGIQLNVIRRGIKGYLVLGGPSD
jgi:serine protease Do